MIQTFNSHLCHVPLLHSCEIGIDMLHVTPWILIVKRKISSEEAMPYYLTSCET